MYGNSVEGRQPRHVARQPEVVSEFEPLGHWNDIPASGQRMGNLTAQPIAILADSVKGTRALAPQ